MCHIRNESAYERGNTNSYSVLSRIFIIQIVPSGPKGRNQMKNKTHIQKLHFPSFYAHTHTRSHTETNNEHIKNSNMLPYFAFIFAEYVCPLKCVSCLYMSNMRVYWMLYIYVRHMGQVSLNLLTLNKFMNCSGFAHHSLATHILYVFKVNINYSSQ